jgi:hypothetical protein
MNPCQNLILAKEKIITTEVESCEYDSATGKYEIRFNTGKIYTYNYESVVWIKNPVKRNPADYEIIHNGKSLFKIKEIYDFEYRKINYWHICFDNNTNADYERKNLQITQSCLMDSTSKKVFDYLKRTAEYVSLLTEEGINLLSKQYEKMTFIPEDSAFSSYVHPEKYQTVKRGSSIPLFPFGCNASQYTAVKSALENQISIIEGPPGTGKTQTILNIVANLVASGKTVQIVSNNNSATANIYEKLCSYGVDFIAAPLGNKTNKHSFLEKQTGLYPDALASWAYHVPGAGIFWADIQKRSSELNDLFINQQRLCTVQQELYALETEFQYFRTYLDETGKEYSKNIVRKNIPSAAMLGIWQECQRFHDRSLIVFILFKLKCRFLYGISTWSFYRNKPLEIVTLLQYRFYTTKQYELKEQIRNLETLLKDADIDKKMNDLGALSLRCFKGMLYARYGNNERRTVFDENDFWKNHLGIQKEYPVVLSTTFSCRSSLCTQAKFDYIIIDESSQVDVATGALALSCAHSAVIVGDSRQLPNVVKECDKQPLQTIFDSYSINPGYSFARKSFLQSVCDIIPNVPKTLLREHYRCHPKIINFCNEKFYDGKLIVMTKDNAEKEVISVIKTVVGNHARDHMNQRQIDVITKEILPSIPCPDSAIGIIAPYNNQVNAIAASVPGKSIDVATVHKFQGREKDAIIISTVDDLFTIFSDDQNLLNVAVSRAKKYLRLVVSGNDQHKSGNIVDLIDYIEYHNFSVSESSIHSVFDFLYSQYTQRRRDFLKSKLKISKYDSENLMYLLLDDILQDDRFAGLEIICHQPLNMLIRDHSRLNDDERRYAMHPWTHLDFLIYNRITKKPILAVEVDGFHVHKKGTRQADRDLKKDHILELYNIPLARLKTNESGEKEKIINKLAKICM